MHLFLVLIFATALSTLSSLGLLPPNTTRAAATEWRGESEVDVLLGVETDNEGWDINDLLADADVTLADEDAGVVDRLGKTELVHAGLEAALQEILDLEGEHVIKLHARLVEHADTDETANEGIAFEETLRVLLLHREQLTRRTLVFCDHSVCVVGVVMYRAARRIFERVSWTRQTSRLFFRPYSPTSFSSESLERTVSPKAHNDISGVKLQLSGR
jgi:hypothetical protein